MRKFVGRFESLTSSEGKKALEFLAKTPGDSPEMVDFATSMLSDAERKELTSLRSRLETEEKQLRRQGSVEIGGSMSGISDGLRQDIDRFSEGFMTNLRRRMENLSPEELTAAQQGTLDFGEMAIDMLGDDDRKQLASLRSRLEEEEKQLQERLRRQAEFKKEQERLEREASRDIVRINKERQQLMDRMMGQFVAKHAEAIQARIDAETLGYAQGSDEERKFLSRSRHEQERMVKYRLANDRHVRESASGRLRSLRRNADEEVRANKQLEAAYQSAVRGSRQASESAIQLTRQARNGFASTAESAMRMGRGFVTLGLLSEESNERILKGFLKVQSLVDIISGGVRLLTRTREMMRDYRDAHRASEQASQKAAEAGRIANEMSKRRSILANREATAIYLAAAAHRELARARRMTGGRGYAGGLSPTLPGSFTARGGLDIDGDDVLPGRSRSRMRGVPSTRRRMGAGVGVGLSSMVLSNLMAGESPTAGLAGVQA